MAAKSAGPSQALIITLIFFILATIILGVTTYLGFDGQSAYAQEAKKANQAKTEWEQNADWHKFQATTLMQYYGTPLPKEYQEKVPQLRQKFGTGQGWGTDPNKEAIAKFIKEQLDGQLGWNDAEKKPRQTILDQMAAMKKSFDDLTKNHEALKAQDDKDRATVNAAQKSLTDARNTYQEDLNKLKKTFDDNLAKHIATINELQNQIADMGKGNEDLKNAMAQLQGDSTKKLAESQKKIKQLEELVKKEQERANPTVNVLDFDQPKGKIVEIDRTGRLPFIDIGSADGAKEQLTFSIYGVGIDGKPISHDVIGPDGKTIVGPDRTTEKEGKGTLEIIKVVDAHMSQCRITSLRDAARDPVLPGDLLFNAAWSPNLRQHVAIAGVIDLTGEGHDDMAEFLRNLERQRVVVDAYLDLKDMSVKGKGVNRQTDFLILGQEPEGASGIQREDDPRVVRRNNVIGEMTKMQKAAEANGVTVISLRKFLAITGYRLPRTHASDAAGINIRSGQPNGASPIDGKFNQK
jgi:uncharacterized protein YoxC